jgi:hypothetical protein
MSKCEDAFDDSPEKKYRYFNQPIEQIPGWKRDDYQVLVHSPDCGLQWHTVQCLDVMTCITKDGNNLNPETTRIVVFKEQSPEDDCPPIECCSGDTGVAGFDGPNTFVFNESSGSWEPKRS